MHFHEEVRHATNRNRKSPLRIIFSPADLLRLGLSPPETLFTAAPLNAALTRSSILNSSPSVTNREYIGKKSVSNQPKSPCIELSCFRIFEGQQFLSSIS
ncbi:hypothetical protein ElyMa_002654900 [Elysia marginata]|uniref:Uncharacterized protein n=1 Tax=Elysia marginata TaxID=1093978 RepID=A0AAV4H8X9_9GAST|nr:hypothetical protein ElyMa_002654900 [Elysia marginata]